MRMLILLAAGAGMAAPASGAFLPSTQNPGSIALGGTTLGCRDFPLCVWMNPSLLAVQHSALSVTFSPGLYGLTELARGGAYVVERTGIGAFGLAGSFFGTNLYRETVLTLGGGWSPAPSFHAGITLSYMHLRIERYGADHTIGVSLGASVEFRPDLIAGFSVANVNNPVIGEAEEHVPREFRFCVEYRPVTGLAVALDLDKETLSPFGVHVGISWRLTEQVGIRIGGSTDPSLVSGGLWVRLTSFGIEYAVSVHPFLGMTHQAALTIFLPDQ